MKNIKSYLKFENDITDSLQTISLKLIEILIWGIFGAVHYIFFKYLLYSPQGIEIYLIEVYVLKFQLNKIIFGGILIIIFQLLRVLINKLSNRIRFSNSTKYKFSIKLFLIYISFIISLSSAISMSYIIFSNEAKQLLGNNLSLLYQENPKLGYLNPLVNSFYYYLDFVKFIFTRTDITAFFLLSFFLNLMLIFMPFVARKNYLKLSTSLKNKSNLDQIAIFGAIQHELGNKLPTLKIDLEALNLFLNQESTPSNIIIEKPIRKKEFEGDYVESVGNLIERIFSKVDYCINATSNLNGIINADPNKFNPEKVELINFLEQETIKYLENQSNISLEFEGNRKIEANIDKKQFSTLLLNVISNALRHGFTENKKNYTLKFIIEEHQFSDFNGKFSLSIKILNDGNPFPQNIKKVEYQTAMKYGGNTGNSGYGGFLISKIIENHSGEFNIFEGDLDTDKLGVGIVIYLP